MRVGSMSSGPKSPLSTLAKNKRRRRYVSRPDLAPMDLNIVYQAPGAKEKIEPGVFLIPEHGRPTSIPGEAEILPGRPHIGIYDAINGEPIYWGTIDQPLDHSSMGLWHFGQRFNSQKNESELYFAGVHQKKGSRITDRKGFMGTISSSYQTSEIVEYSTTNYHEHTFTKSRTLLSAYNTKVNVTGLHFEEDAELTLYNTTSLNQKDVQITLVDGCFSEDDLEGGGKRLFQWCAHEAGVRPESSRSVRGPDASRSTWDYFHLNSVDKDALDNYLVSARHMCAVYYISGQDGTILWQLGGKDSTMNGNGTDFRYQHDARWIYEDHLSIQEISTQRYRYLSLFDNGIMIRRKGNKPLDDKTRASRGVIIKLDLQNKEAIMENTFNTPVHVDEIAYAEGGFRKSSKSSSQFLASYGMSQHFTEFEANGTPLRTVQYASPFGSKAYRIFKVDWNATPSDTIPDVAIVNNGSSTAYISWNGATNVDKWVLMQGSRQCAISKKTGFETKMTVPNSCRSSTTISEPLCVLAIDGQDRLLAHSKAMWINGSSADDMVCSQVWHSDSRSLSSSSPFILIPILCFTGLYLLIYVLVAARRYFKRSRAHAEYMQLPTDNSRWTEESKMLP